MTCRKALWYSESDACVRESRHIDHGSVAWQRARAAQRRRTPPGLGRAGTGEPNAPNEEVTVKHDNAYAENFDIVAASGCARYGDLIYTSTCTPAWW